MIINRLIEKLWMNLHCPESMISYNPIIILPPFVMFIKLNVMAEGLIKRVVSHFNTAAWTSRGRAVLKNCNLTSPIFSSSKYQLTFVRRPSTVHKINIIYLALMFLWWPFTMWAFMIEWCPTPWVRLSVSHHNLWKHQSKLLEKFSSMQVVVAIPARRKHFKSLLVWDYWAKSSEIHCYAPSKYLPRLVELYPKG